MAIGKTLKFGRDRLLRAFNKPQDVEFYLSHEDTLIEDFIEGIYNYSSEKPLVVLIDTYEEVMELDMIYEPNCSAISLTTSSSSSPAATPSMTTAPLTGVMTPTFLNSENSPPKSVQTASAPAK